MISLHLKISKEHRWLNTEGESNRLNGFSYRLWHPNGQLVCVEYWVDGALHNPKGPACRRWDENGQLCWESYWVDGERHNLKGPARRSWNENGQLWWEQYWAEGAKVDKSTLENL